MTGPAADSDIADSDIADSDIARHPRRDFAIAYAFWVIVFASIAISIWLSSSGLSAFRYAGF